MDKENIFFEEEYVSKFKTNKLTKVTTKDPITKEALEKALDIRKFEIDLYWKRATYFWGFLIVIFAGYFAVFGANLKDFSSKEKLTVLLLISSLGFIFSYSWFLVNKGSKFWQNNWERHVDMLEDQNMGPLYKTVLVEPKKKGLINHITMAEEYSVSKVNQILSFFLVIIWGFITVVNMIKIGNDYIVNEIGIVWITDKKILHFPIAEVVLIVLTIFFYFVLKTKGMSSHKKGAAIDSYFTLREKALPSQYKKSSK